MPAAVASAAAPIAAAIDAVVDRLQARRPPRLRRRRLFRPARGGRRLRVRGDVLAAPGQVVALLAGADAPSSLEQEAAEDDAEAGARDARSRSASGPTTP